MTAPRTTPPNNRLQVMRGPLTLVSLGGWANLAAAAGDPFPQPVQAASAALPLRRLVPVRQVRAPLTAFAPIPNPYSPVVR